MKTKKTVLNVVINAILQFCNIVLMLILRRVFSDKLGDELLGLNSVYSSLMSFLTISELGLGVTIAVCLYKPLAENDKEKITSYMSYLKRLYSYIGLFVLIAGTALIPFLPYIVKERFDFLFMSISFELYVISTSVSYFLSYKKVIFGADQKSYIISASQTIYKVVQGIAQILVVYYFQNYYAFVGVSVICNLSENYVLSLFCNKKYPYICKSAKQLTIEEKKDIGTKVIGMLCSKITNYLIQGTDNIILSAFIGVSIVTYYNNYNLIITYLYVIFASFAVSAVAGLGNLIYTEKERVRFVFSKMLIVQQFLFSFSASSFLVLSPFFVKRLFPSTIEMGKIVILLMVSITYLRGYSEAIESIRNCVGEYSDKIYNLLSALLNVVVSILLVKQLGVVGVMIGTLVSYVIKEFVLVPIVVFKKILPGGMKWYYIVSLKNLLLTVLISMIIDFATIFIPITSWGRWIIYGFVALLISFSINALAYKRTKEYSELKTYVISCIKKVFVTQKRNY